MQDAFDTSRSELLQSLWSTPAALIGRGSSGGAELSFFAPPFKWSSALSLALQTPLDSHMYTASFWRDTWISVPTTATTLSAAAGRHCASNCMHMNYRLPVRVPLQVATPKTAV